MTTRDRAITPERNEGPSILPAPLGGRTDSAQSWVGDPTAFNAAWSADLCTATGRDVLTAGEARAHGGNRKGYAAYEHEPWSTQFTLSGTPPTGVPNAETGPLMQLAKHRFYRADLGAWTRRDPLGYLDGMNVNRFVADNPIANRYPTGLRAINLPYLNGPCRGRWPIATGIWFCISASISAQAGVCTCSDPITGQTGSGSYVSASFCVTGSIANGVPKQLLKCEVHASSRGERGTLLPTGVGIGSGSCPTPGCLGHL